MARGEFVMGEKYQPHSDYKNSGIEWIGGIPRHWSTSYLGFECSVRARLGWKGLKAEEYVTEGYVFLATPNIKNKEIDFVNVDRITKERYDESPEIMLAEGDVLVTKDGSTTGTTNAVRSLPEPATVNSSIAVLRSKGNVQSSFLYYFFTSDYTQNIINRMRGGMGVPHLFQADLRKFDILVPPEGEQQTIANFLDHETAKIDTLIEKQQQLIKLLKEKRQAVISHAVTKGLNPDAPMRDSGVEWLGEVPEGWVITKAKFVSEIFIPQRNKPELNDFGGVAWATMEDMRNRYIVSTKQFVSVAASKEAGSKTLKVGSVIASCVGNFGVASINKVDVIINQQLQAFVPCGIKAEYLREIVSISTVYFDLVGTAATLIYVNQQGFENLPVIVPPECEQNDICVYVDKECSKFDRLVHQCEITIELLHERRTALISAAVTGKIDVRNWVAPEPANEPMDSRPTPSRGHAIRGNDEEGGVVA